MSKPLPFIHYTEGYLINPQHPVSINVIGAGGTGSQVLNSLARMDSALRALGHPGLWVRAIDPDKVTEANLGRQLFSPADLGEYKATVLISRINRFFGYDWESEPQLFTEEISSANITISCVDSGAARAGIKKVLQAQHLAQNPKGASIPGRPSFFSGEPYFTVFYWLDFGNTQDRGQAILGTFGKIEQPKSKEFQTVDTLPTVDKVHRDILKDHKDDDQGPSCSLAEALQRQDLFINTNLANMGLTLLWKLFREARISYHGLYMNLSTLQTNPLKIKR